MLPNDLTYMPAWKMASLIRKRELSPIDLTAHFIERMTTFNPDLNAFVTMVTDMAIEQAKRAEVSLLSGEDIGPLHGVPIGIKDLNPTKGIRTTYGSRLFKDHIPSSDDIVVERIRKSGAIIIGKTNTPEFGWKGTTENLLLGPCRNPWNREMTSGGSSGGAGSALAAGLIPLANGSDAGGSIRIPASFCGVYGLKPTFGRVPSDYNRGQGWSPFSQNGPMSNNVLDSAILLQILSGKDPRDPRAIQEEPADFITAVGHPSINGLKIAWCPSLGGWPVDVEVAQATTNAAIMFEEMGATIEEVNLSTDMDQLIESFSTIMLTDLSMVVSPAIDEGRSNEITPALAKWVGQSASLPISNYPIAIKHIEWHRHKFQEFFDSFDLLLTPTMAVPSFPINAFPAIVNGLAVDRRWGYNPFCFQMNITGNPAASIPCGFTADGLPIGLQIIGHHRDEAKILQASAAFENDHPWGHSRPAL
jgi:aspartyl-tRNA(Asn)/glutamyl-tRNA(Gln) amidotransferase subunit A